MNGILFGNNTGQTDATSLFLKIYKGSFNAAPRSSIFLHDKGIPGVEKMDGAGSKSIQFLMFGDQPDPQEFDPGDLITGQSFAIDEGTITPDKYIVASAFFRKDQLNYSQDAARTLSRVARGHSDYIQRMLDRRAMITGCLAYRTAAVNKTVGSDTRNIHQGGNVVVRNGSSATVSTAMTNAYALSAAGAAALRADIRSLGYKLDLDNIPDGPANRGLFITPYGRQVLLCDTTNQVFSKDFIETSDGNKVTQRQITTLDGFRILGHPTATSGGGPLPDENISNLPSKYNANFLPQASTVGTPIALAICNDGSGGAPIGMGTWDAIKSELIWVPERLGWLAFSYIHAGFGVMNPWCAGGIEVTSS